MGGACVRSRRRVEEERSAAEAADEVGRGRPSRLRHRVTAHRLSPCRRIPSAPPAPGRSVRPSRFKRRRSESVPCRWRQWCTVPRLKLLECWSTRPRGQRRKPISSTAHFACIISPVRGGQPEIAAAAARCAHVSARYPRCALHQGFCRQSAARTTPARLAPSIISKVRRSGRQETGVACPQPTPCPRRSPPRGRPGCDWRPDFERRRGVPALYAAQRGVHTA